MQEYSRPLGDAVRCARIRQGLTQKQLADKLNVDERTIMSIEKYRSNTTMEILYPLLRTLNIDARVVFNPETETETSMHYRLRLLISGCSEDEIKTLVPVCEALISALRSKNVKMIE